MQYISVHLISIIDSDFTDLLSMKYVLFFHFLISNSLSDKADTFSPSNLLYVLFLFNYCFHNDYLNLHSFLIA